MDYQPILQAIRQEDAPAVLATIASVKGHAYRKTGAAMLFRLQSGSIGSISPGCLEADLLARVPDVWRTGDMRRVDYNMNPDEDAIWGESVGCGGAISVMLEPVRGHLWDCLTEAGRRMERGETTRLIREQRGGLLHYRLESGDAAESASEDPQFPRTLLVPRPPLLLFGAGEDAMPISRLAQEAGFRVIVADWREGLLKRERFPGAELVAGAPEAIIAAAGIRRGGYAVIGSHQAHRDSVMLAELIQLEMAYIGIIGSQRRIQLVVDGLDGSRLAPIHAPAGIRIGAEGPCEIAVSIVAELIAVRSQRRALRAKGGHGSENRRHLFGSWIQQTNGRTQAVARAFAGHYARQPRA
ncbi:XdhC family protein [Paenibacillus methanolicus]|uniref:Xanthine dehydrogenase accessory factor n=1 Tax=Paenibacillus methanolicus TaxID=582686 RepID=A0A5S5CM60_9BACL|nr:XdhC/CoxI family protein [Paenibacillus methanolicus]TYP79591.1 xanthine dehydrogenase accessory factor [Paenibacillus methanolicus]